ncbi:hypothetical protein EV182_003072, partial [Spiromyces aspiralis]
VITALFTCKYDLSAILAIAMAVLTLSSSFQCTAADGQKIECSACRQERRDAEGNLSHYHCDPIGGAFSVAVSGFSNDVPWLVFTAFHIGKAVEASGLGKRVSLRLLSLFGGSLLGVAYAIVTSEIALAAFIPSNTARGGGIIFPIVSSVISALDLSFTSDLGAVGAFLVMSAAYANLVSSSLFITGMAGNPILAYKAGEILGIEVGFVQWLVGTIVPGLCIAGIMPLVLYHYYAPVLAVSSLHERVKHETRELGPISAKEVGLSLVLLGCLVLWVGTPVFAIPSTVVAYTALVTLILLDILEWKDIANNRAAWDSFFWLACFIVLAEQLTALGVTHWLGEYMASHLGNASPLMSCVALSLTYYFSTYFFSSITSHLVALAGPLLSAAGELGCQPHLAFVLFAMFSSLAAVLTPFSTGTMAIYASLQFVPRKDWFLVGLLMTATMLAILFTVGMLWWKAIGWL